MVASVRNNIFFIVSTLRRLSDYNKKYNVLNISFDFFLTACRIKQSIFILYYKAAVA